MVISSSPEQETEASNRHIPPEMVEQILLNLPIKSLLRFSCVATSWNSIITSPQFVAEHGGGRKMVMINDNPSYFDFRDAFCRPLSTITNRHVRKSTSSNPVYPFEFEADVKLLAFCDGLCCVSAKNSLYLWNPSTGACKNLPDAPPLDRWFMPALTNNVVYGLGYDAVHDDYKLLKIWRSNTLILENKSFIYSLKSDSWREIPGDQFPFPDSNGLFVDGALNWMAISSLCVNWQLYEYSSTLISFGFSTEEFRVLEQPPYLPQLNFNTDIVDVVVLSGKLCVFVNNVRSYWDTTFVLWAMEDYGVVESWTKLFDISYKNIHPIVSEFRRGTSFTLRPLYLYEDGRIVIWACSGYKKWDIIVYKGGKTLAHSKIFALRGTISPAAYSPRSRVCGGFVYVESLVSPTKWNLH